MVSEREMGPPPQVKPEGLADYLEVMSKAVFQSGMSWKVVEGKWDTTREAFHNFDATTVASMSEAEIDALGQDTRVIRNHRKLNAIVSNAARMVELDAEHGSFAQYLADSRPFEEQVKVLKKDFKFLGTFGTYYFLFVVGEQVPDHDEWRASISR